MADCSNSEYASSVVLYAADVNSSRRSTYPQLTDAEACFFSHLGFMASFVPLLRGLGSFVGVVPHFCYPDNGWRRSSFGRISLLATVGNDMGVLNGVGPGGWCESTRLIGVVTVVR